MDAHLYSPRHSQLSFVSIVFFISLLGGIVSHNLVSFLAPQHHTADLVHTNKHLIARNDVIERGLGDLLSNFSSSVGSGLSSLLPSSSTLLSDLSGVVNTSGIVDSLVEPAKFLGIGLGDGALAGLNMSGSANTTVPSGADGIAQNLGMGLTSSIFSSDSVKSLLNFNASSLGSSTTVGQAVLALAQGLGGGAASGLKLTTTATKAVTNQTSMYNTSGINGVAGNFGQGLSSSFTGGVQLPSLKTLMSMGSSAFGSAGGSSLDIAAIGTGFGSGIGQGAAIGLGYQKDVSTNSTQDVAGITQGFAKGLVASFLQNGTLTEVTNSLSSGNSSVLSLSSIDVAKVAEGLAVGLISGVGSQISTLQVIETDSTSFNDSVSGAATGFGRGLGTEGAKLVQDLLASSSSKATSKKRSLSDLTTKTVRLVKRDATSINATDLASVIATLNASNINPLIQTGINDLTCEGVGGIVGVLLGLVQSKTIDINALTKSSSTLTSNTTVNLPDQVFIIRSGGNTYSLNPAKGITTVLINGTTIIPFIGIAAAHIIFAILAYFVAIPLLLLLINTQKFTILLGTRHPSTLPSKWQTFLGYSIFPLALLTFALGIGFRGSGKHFTSAHEILGLIVFLQTLIAAGTTYFLKRPSPESLAANKVKLAHFINIGLMLFLSFLTLLFGFTDVSSLSLCVTQSIVSTSGWMALGWLLLSPIMLAVGLQGLVFWLGWTRASKVAGVGRLKEEDIVKANVAGDEKSYVDV